MRIIKQTMTGHLSIQQKKVRQKLTGPSKPTITVRTGKERRPMRFDSKRKKKLKLRPGKSLRKKMKNWLSTIKSLKLNTKKLKRILKTKRRARSKHPRKKNRKRRISLMKN